jgi:hypothetical protein
LVEVAVLRYKGLIGRSFRARTLPASKVEATVGCRVIKIITSLGIPGALAEYRGPGRRLARAPETAGGHTRQRCSGTAPHGRDLNSLPWFL